MILTLVIELLIACAAMYGVLHIYRDMRNRATPRAADVAAIVGYACGGLAFLVYALRSLLYLTESQSAARSLYWIGQSIGGIGVLFLLVYLMLLVAAKLKTGRRGL
ncbi:MAG: hypothetical protein NT018_11020 [Armatimonadetes bacterium]|nr:hypothetical protein [Armatimonadota bacterium]